MKNGGVALLPTDTVYGLMAAPTHPEAVAKIFALKGRPAKKNLPILVADIEQISSLGLAMDARVRALLSSRFVPGALTLVLPIARNRAPEWLAARTEAAVRMPNCEALLGLLRQTGPLLATSANASGQETPAEPPAILAQLSGAPDIVVDSGPRTGQPSTLINCQTTPFSTIRRGALTPSEIEEILAL